MQVINPRAIQKAVESSTQTKSSTTTKQQTFSSEDKDRVAYFFMRLTVVYGNGMITSQWPSEGALRAAKLEYAAEICVLSRQEIDEIIQAVKQKRKEGDDKYQWPNVDACLSILRSDLCLTAQEKAAHKIHEPSRLLAHDKPTKHDRESMVKKYREQIGL